MRRFLVLPLIGFAALIPALSQTGAGPFEGRWDITVSTSNGSYPGWMEVAERDDQLQVRVQPRAGSVRPVKDAKSKARA